MENVLFVDDSKLTHRVFYTKDYFYFKYIELGVFMVMLAVIMLLFAFQISSSDLATALRLNSRIRTNLTNLENNVIPLEKTAQQQIRYSNLVQNAYVFSCLDIGHSYLPVRINPDTYSYQGVRRGVGDIWASVKSAEVDEAAKQFCEFLIRERNDSVIECGQDMYKKLGYPGYTNIEHWCTDTIQKFIDAHN